MPTPTHMNKSTTLLIIALLAVLLLAGCAPGPNPAVQSPDAEGIIAGFWFGLWHGFIAPVTFIISIFVESVHFYEVHNNGIWYNLGFLLGISVAFGGSSAGACKSR